MKKPPFDGGRESCSRNNINKLINYKNKERWAGPKVRKGPSPKEKKEMGQKIRPIPI